MKEEAVEKPRRSDPYIWGIIIILYIVSVVEVYSAISREITGGDVYSPIIKHALLLFSGFLITYATSRVHYKWFKVMAYLMIPATIVLLVSILLWGDTLNGAKRTIPVMGISLQGSEVAKVTIVLAMATVLAKSQIKRGVNTKGVVLVVVLVTIFSGLLFTQGLTNTLLFIGISVCMMLIGGVEWYKLGIIFLAYLVLALAVMQAKDILTESELFNKQAQTEQTAQAGEQVEQKKVLIQRSSTWKSRLEDFFDSTPEYEKETTDANRQEHRAAMAMAQLNGCTAEELKYGMRTYRGVERRFDFKIKTDRIVFLSDYAHHPKEIRQSAMSIRELYKDKKITAIFQPHLYSRTRDFYKDFAESLSLLDEVLLCDIYPAREEPIPGVTSRLIYDNLAPGVAKVMLHKEDVPEYVREHDFEVLIVLGAGDLDNYVPQIEKILLSKYE